MTDIKQVKVDNWGIYFLQRLKHFFNRTDYCDLTLQFQDNAQLKVHRLVLSACTEYFELLERTCEMYEDCLVMPDDLQADVVVPIVNFMYTGHLEFRMDLLERLYQTSQILNMPVLTKLLESHRLALKTTAHSYGGIKRFTKTSEPSKIVKPTTSNKRSYSKAFDNNNIQLRDKKVYHSIKMPEATNSPSTYRPPSPLPMEPSISNKKSATFDPRPTRYELPEELDNDNVFDNSFCNISYTCKPLMVHPENVKRYSSKRSGIFSEASSSKKLMPGTSTVDIVECKRIAKDDNIFDDGIPDHSMNDDLDLFQSSYNTEAKDSSQLFDQILDEGPKVTIETKDNKAASNLDHAKIISEVLKKYPHLVKSNKNIKLKILNTPGKGKKQQKASPTYVEEMEKKPKLKTEAPDYTYETDVIDSQQAAKLIAMGAENTKGPWICLICGTPGKALHFTSYYKFRRHLVEVHNEKPVSNICEYCGLRSLKRNYLLHHLYSQHGVDPPPQYNFPKCNRCNYIALTEGLLVKHKMTHKDVKNFRCNVCSAPFTTTKQLLQHIQVTGHKYSAERKTNLQCIYCLKSFLRDGNLYAHLKTYHRKEAKSDGIIEDSDDEKPTEEVSRPKSDNREPKYHHIKFEPVTYDNEYEEVDMQYQIQQRHDGDIQLTPRKQHNVILNTKQKILNPGFGTPKPPAQKAKPARKPAPPEPPSNFLEDISIPSPPINNHNDEEIVLIDNTEYILRDNQLIPRKPKSGSNEYVITDMIEPASLQSVQPTTSIGYTDVHNTKTLDDAQRSILMKKTNVNQPIQIVVSNEEEYKALMSSNHRILFDNGDANKTLTVLTTPHTSAIETAAIDLDNTQSNDMMIIQEDYPLNVTEAVSTDNSNIVVVYSHPVDQNKQFQILTTGGIGSQFVQSSAIITQNYETVTTSTPVMSALESQTDTTWQGNIQGGPTQQVPVDHEPELQNVSNVEIKSLENDTSNNLSELPEVHLAPVPQTIVPEDIQVTNTANELSVVNSEHISQAIAQEIEEESHNIPETQMETDILRESIVEQEATAMIDPMQMSHENLTEVLSNNMNQEVLSSNVNHEVLSNNVNQEVHDVNQEVHDANLEVHNLHQEVHDIQQVDDVHQKVHDVHQDIHHEVHVVPQEVHAVPQEVHDVHQEDHDAVHQHVRDVVQEAVHDLHQEVHAIPQEVHDAHQVVHNINQDVHNIHQIHHVHQEVHEMNQEDHDMNQDVHDMNQDVQNQIETERMNVEQSATEITPEEQIGNPMIVTDNSVITENVNLCSSLEDPQPLPESQAYDDIVDINDHGAKGDPQPYSKETVDKIQNLASEWSEDEYDIVEDTPSTVAHIPGAIQDIPPSRQLEETIENIQLEVQNHVTSGPSLTTIRPLPDVETEESESSIPEDTVLSPQETQLTSTAQTSVSLMRNDPQTQQKISSLLNDWEDNDSQEENNSDNPTVENKDVETDVTMDKTPKTDNIKILVSDWDEEDEDIKDN